MANEVYDPNDEQPVVEPDLQVLENIGQTTRLQTRESRKTSKEADGTADDDSETDDLKKAEEEPDDGGFWKGDRPEEKDKGGGVAAAASLATPGGLAKKAFSALSRNKKKAAAGGGIAGILIGMILGLGSLSAFQLQELRDNALNDTSTGGVVNQALNNRRNKTLRTVVNDAAKGGGSALATNPKLDSTLERYGFDLTRDSEGKLIKLGFKSGSTDISHSLAGLSDNELDNVLKDFFSKSEVEDAFGKALKYDAATWKGKAATRVYQFMKVNFANWLSRTPSEKATTDEEKLSDDLRHADDGVFSDSGKTLDKAPSDLGGKTDKVDDLTVESDKAPDYRKQLLDNPTAGDELTGDAIAGAAGQDVIDQAGKDLPDTLAKNDAGLLKALQARIFTTVPTSLLAGGAEGINIVAVPQEACRIKGTLNFIANVRNVIFAYELARFSVKILTAADDQKAGIMSSDGLHLLLLYMNRPNPANGKSSMQSGGIQYLLGNSSAKVSETNLSRVSTGRNNGGVLETVSNFISTNPVTSVALSPTKCKVVNNGLVTVAGFATGALFSVFGGAESGATETNIVLSISMQILKEVVYTVGTPILIKSGAHLVMNGLENGELVGDSFASGIGALKGMNGGAQGLRPITRQKAAVLRQEASNYKQELASKESLYDRYLNPRNSSSLATTVMMKIPSSFASLGTSLRSLTPRFLSSIANFNLARALPLLSGRVRAAEASNQCQDPQAVKMGIETDPFCNPVMADVADLDVQQTETVLIQAKQINSATKQPVDDSDFSKFIKNCFSGNRPDVLYSAEVSKGGTDLPENNDCITSGDPLPGDNVGMRDRFSTYYGYLNDLDDLTTIVNNGYYGN